jgi:hypothetical protein
MNDGETVRGEYRTALYVKYEKKIVDKIGRRQKQQRRSASRATFIVEVEEERIVGYVWAMASNAERDSCCFSLNTINNA